MIKIKSTLLALLFFFIISTCLFAEAQGKTTQRLEWQALANASAYGVEVVKEGNIDSSLFEYQLEVETAFVDLLLVPGTYFYRITVLNKFRKPSTKTKWTKLVIKAAKRPYFQYYSYKPLYEGDDNLKITASVVNFLSDSKFLIVNDSNELELSAASVALKSKSELILNFTTVNLPSGSYHLVCRNPSGLEDYLEDAILIEKRIQPKFFSISKNKLYIGEIFTDIEIKGSHFQEGISVLAPQESGIVVSNIRFQDERTLLVWMDLTDAEPGDYQLTLSNPSGLDDFTNDIEVLEYGAGMRPEKVKTGFGIVARIPVAFGDMPDLDSPGLFTGFGLSLESDFGGLVPFLKWMGYSLFFEYKEIGSPWLADNYFKYEMIHYINLGSSFYLTTRYDKPINFFVEAGIGLSLHKNQLPEEDSELQQKAMAGLFLMAGLGIDFSFRPDLIFRVGGELQYSYAEDGEHLLPEFYIELGYRFRHNRNLNKYVTEDESDS